MRSELNEQENVEQDPSKQDLEPLSLQKQVEISEKTQKKFGMFAGVFTPTLLTILGVILFLREGWVFGNAGFLGGTLIILLSFLITGCTALSMSSFVTNTRVGGGGAFSIVAQALGLEAGGSIGIPLYVSQALAVCMYIFGFRAGWLMIFPDHPALIVDYTVFLAIFGITIVSTGFVFRIQYVILAILGAALLSIFAAAFTGSMQYPLHWWGNFEGSIENNFSGISFWGVFAVFFPASTGIMAGANMSGELKDPRKSIPLGTLLAIGVSLIVYLAVGYWVSKSATQEELLTNYMILIERSFWSPIVLAGLLAATFSSALSSFVGAPRILEALGGHNIVPLSRWLAKRSRRQEPLNAIFFTFVLVGIVLLLRDLNIVAPLITMFFLITYNVLNLVILIEDSLKLMSFRPYFRVPKIYPLLGFIGSIFAMFIISPVFGLVSVAAISVIYGILLKRRLKSPFNDVRSGLFETLAEWAAKKVILFKSHSDRAWQPNILLPIENVNRLSGAFRLVTHLALPVGSVKLLGIQQKEQIREFEKELENAAEVYLKHNIFSTFSVMEEESFSRGIQRGMQALRGSFFRPNVLFLELPKDPSLHKDLWNVIETATYSKIGIAMIIHHKEAELGREETINLWIPKPEKWTFTRKLEGADLATLLGYRIFDNWKGALRLFMAVDDPKEIAKGKKYLNRLIHLARLRVEQLEVFESRSLVDAVKEAPQGDLNIYSLNEVHKLKNIWALTEAAGSTCLLCRDSGFENAFA